MTGDVAVDKQPELIIRRVPFDEAISRCGELFERHWEYFPVPGRAMAPKYDWYRAAEKDGRYSCFLATVNDDGPIVGYAGAFINEHWLFNGTVLSLDIIYVPDEFRGHRLVDMILAALNEFAVNAGCVACIYPCPNQRASAPLERAVRRRGAEPMERTYIEILGDGRARNVI